ncbi:hypothetical protein LG58_1724 [Kosakonia radicincitans YD4]|nr:hypothetical protein LG58_1724 [Kosakonia radicincitans YD4]
MIFFIAYAQPKIADNNQRISERITSWTSNEKIWTPCNINASISMRNPLFYFTGGTPSKINSSSPSVAMNDLFSEDVHNAGEKIQAGFKHDAYTLTNITT